jgi:beta-hydroxylase
VEIEAQGERQALWRESGGRSPSRPRALFPYNGLIQRASDRLIAASSLVSTEPVLDVRDFPWTATLRANWQTIRDEVAPRGQLADCPTTASILRSIPGLEDAALSVLAPRTHVPTRRGATKGLITCHLGLAVPRDGDVRMRVGRRFVRWAEGETLLFDDSCDHELWNDAGADRLVLGLQFRRPLRQPGRWVADKLLTLIPGPRHATWAGC